MSSTGTWGDAVTLTTDSLMDHAARLAAGNDGTAMALWQTNDGTDMLGTAAHPLTYTYALWDGTAWLTPTAAVTGLHDVIDAAFAAYSATQAALVYVVDADGALTTTADADLYYAAFDGTAWSSPTAITADAITDTAPALAYDAAGNPHLLWLRGGPSTGSGQALVWLENSWDVADAETVRPASTEGGFLGLALARGPSGNLALVWQAMGADGADLAYSVYDASVGLWGADQALTTDADVERGHSPVFAADGLYLACQKVETEFVTRTFALSPTLTFTVTGVPQPGTSSLAFLAHTIGQDLALEGLSVTPANPAPGQAVTLTAVLRNAGDLAVTAPQVAL